MILRRDPICKVCDRNASVEVDHIIPKARGGDNSDENLQGICGECHTQKTTREAAEARS